MSPSHLPYAIINLSAVPLRAEPSDRSEMTSQLLLGDTLEILEQKDKWVRVRCSYDNYEGWINPRQALPINISEYEQYNQSTKFILSDTIALAESNGWVQILTMGSSLPYFNEGVFKIGDKSFTLHGQAIDNTNIQVTTELIQTSALKLLHAPYLWGGKSALGIDCSGFTQVIFKTLGIKLMRDTYQQAEQGRIVNILEQAQTGDLAFFNNDSGKIVHVGILLDNKTIIHASGSVRIDRIDHQGIFNTERKSYTHNLKIIKRIV